MSKGIIKKIDEVDFILVVITHLFEDTDLPIELDFIFQDKNVANSDHMKIVIRVALIMNKISY